MSSALDRFVAGIDSLFGARVPKHDADEHHRAGLIGRATLLFAATALALTALNLALGWGDRFAAITMGIALVFLANAWVLGKTGRIDVAALCLCLTTLAGAVAASWMEAGPLCDPLIWAVVICGSAGLLVPPRLGLLCAGLASVHFLALYLAARWGHVFPGYVSRPTGLLVNQIGATLVLGALVWLHDRSRRKAVTTRDAALAALEESQEARVALVENIGAVIFSVDPELRLITGNSLFKALSAAPGGSPILPGQPVLDGLAPAQHDGVHALFARALSGEHFVVEHRLELRSKTVECEVVFNPIRKASGEIRGITVLGRDISERKRVQAELDRANRALADAAHLAGKAEVATEVLHTVGNVLTGIDGTAAMVRERLGTSKLSFLAKTVALLPVAPETLASYLATDEKGRRVREYMTALADSLDHERVEMTEAMASLGQQLDHLKSVVARQQAHARPQSVIEMVALKEVILQALELTASGIRSRGIRVTTELATLPELALDRHKLCEILVNLIANSCQSFDDSPRTDRSILVGALRNAAGGLQIDVTDNGTGIAPEHLDRLFRYGFTTKAEGHGFGLASSLLCARAMSGTVRAHSDGPGKGATFTIELPFPTPPGDTAQESAA